MRIRFFKVLVDLTAHCSCWVNLGTVLHESSSWVVALLEPYSSYRVAPMPPRRRRRGERDSRDAAGPFGVLWTVLAGPTTSGRRCVAAPTLPRWPQRGVTWSRNRSRWSQACEKKPSSASSSRSTRLPSALSSSKISCSPCSTRQLKRWSYATARPHLRMKCEMGCV